MHCTLIEAALNAGSNAACPDAEQLPAASCIIVACHTFLHAPAASQPAASTKDGSGSPNASTTSLNGGSPIDLRGDFFLCTRTDLNNSRWAHGGSCWQLNQRCYVPCEVQFVLAQKTAHNKLQAVVVHMCSLA